MSTVASSDLGLLHNNNTTQQQVGQRAKSGKRRIAMQWYLSMDQEETPILCSLTLKCKTKEEHEKEEQKATTNPATPVWLKLAATN